MIALRARRRPPPSFIAWAAAFLAYTGLWAYYVADYGLFYTGPMPWWLTDAMAVTLVAALILTCVMWWRMRKRSRL